MSLNNTMRVLRVFLGLTMAEWARRCKVSTSHVSFIEQGERQVTEDYIKKVLKAIPIGRERLYNAVPIEFRTLEREQLRIMADVLKRVLGDYEGLVVHDDAFPQWRGDLIEEAKRALEVVS